TLRFASNVKATHGLISRVISVPMNSSAGTPMIVRSCEPPQDVSSMPIPDNEMGDYDPARVLDRFVRCGLAGNTEQRASGEFSRVAPSARVLSLRMVWSHRGHR